MVEGFKRPGETYIAPDLIVHEGTLKVLSRSVTRLPLYFQKITLAVGEGWPRAGHLRLECNADAVSLHLRFCISNELMP